MVDGTSRRSKQTPNTGLLGEALGPSATEAGKELAPAVKRLATSAAKAIELLADMIEQRVARRREIWEQVRNEVAKKVDALEPDKLCAPDPRIVVPALEGLSFSLGDDQVREMFLNLIASDMNIEAKGSTHPAFGEIIKQMTAIEARILVALRDQAHVLIKTRLQHDVRLKEPEQELSLSLEGVAPYLVVRGLSNLCRLGLVTITSTEHPVGQLYDEAESRVKASYAEFKRAVRGSPALMQKYRITQFPKMRLSKEGIYLTPLGRAFARVCFK